MTTTSYNIYQQITSVRLATTANLSGTYFNGSINNGIGATLTASVVGALSIDGVLAEVGDRILVKNQTSVNQNGIYVVRTTGSPIGIWSLERSPDFQSLEQLKVGQYFTVGAGLVSAGSIFVLVEPLPTIIGMSAFTFVDVADSGSPAGPFLLKSDNLSDLTNRRTAFQNMGFGNASLLVLTDADFAGVGGTYVLSNPPPNIVSMTATTPGRVLQLPPSNDPNSLQVSEQIELITGTPSQSIGINNGAGALIFSVDADSAWRAVSNDTTTIAGVWEFLGEVQTINGSHTGNVVLTSDPQTVYVAPSGSDVPAQNDGSILFPYASLSYALSQITTASQATPFEIVMSTGSYSELGDVSLKPWVHVEGNNAIINIAGQLLLDASWGTIANPRAFVRFVNINAVGGALLNRTVYQANSLLFFNAVNFSLTPSLSASGAGTNVDAEIIAFFYCLPINGGAPLYTLTNLLSVCVGSGFQAGLTVANTSAITNNVLVLENSVPFDGDLILQSTSSGVLTAILSAVPRLFGNFTIDGTNVNVLIDSTSWTFTPLFLNGATISQFILSSKSDGVNCSSFVPTNFIPVGSSTDLANSLTAYLRGIDAAISGATGIPPAYAEMYFQDNVTVTTIAALNTPVKVDATYNFGLFNEFTHLNGTLTYTGTTLRTMNVVADLTATYNGTSQNTSFYIALNGVVVAKSKQSTYIGAVTPANQANPCSALLTLVNGDTLELWVENNDNANDIIVTDLNFNVHNISGFDSGMISLAGENYLSLVASTLTANPVNLGNTNVTGLLPLNKVADISTSIDAITLAGSSGTGSIAFISSQEQRIGNLVNCTVKISFTSSANSVIIDIEKTYGGNFSTINQACGSGACARTPTPTLGDAQVQSVDSIVGMNRIQLLTRVGTLVQDYILECNFMYEVT